MTMPHLMNCQHDDHGWCLACVKKIGEENYMLRDQLDQCLPYLRHLSSIGYAGATVIVLQVTNALNWDGEE